MVRHQATRMTPAFHGHRVGFASDQGQRRFAAPAHQNFSTFPNGGPALEASWSHTTLK